MRSFEIKWPTRNVPKVSELLKLLGQMDGCSLESRFSLNYPGDQLRAVLEAIHYCHAYSQTKVSYLTLAQADSAFAPEVVSPKNKSISILVPTLPNAGDQDIFQMSFEKNRRLAENASGFNITTHWTDQKLDGKARPETIMMDWSNTGDLYINMMYMILNRMQFIQISHLPDPATGAPPEELRRHEKSLRNCVRMKDYLIECGIEAHRIFVAEDHQGASFARGERRTGQASTNVSQATHRVSGYLQMLGSENNTAGEEFLKSVRKHAGFYTMTDRKAPSEVRNF